MGTRVYFTRIEHINDFVNARPIYQLYPHGLFEVDSASIGKHGTITVSHGEGQSGLEDGRYCIFSITDNDFERLEVTQNGPRIRPKDLLSRIKTVDTYSIREVIEIPSDYNIENYNSWCKNVFEDVEIPITKNVYLSNNGRVYGPFKYQIMDNSGYIFSPNSANTGNSDANIIRAYAQTQLVANKALVNIIETPAERNNYRQINRKIIYLTTLPKEYEEFDCISDDVLKQIVANLLASESMTKAERKRLKETISSLPSEVISDNRRERVLQFFANDEMADHAVKLIPTVLTADGATLSALLAKVFSNKDYINKVYPVIKEQEGFTEELSHLEAEKAEKEQELQNINKDIEEKRLALNSRVHATDKELSDLKAAVQARDQQLAQYKEKEELAREISDLQKDKESLRQSRRDIEREIEEHQDTLKNKIKTAYSSLAFDGTIASMMIEEAAKFEKQRKKEQLKNQIARTGVLNLNTAISEPQELVDFLYDAINNIGHRSISKNDIANVLICLSQDFITIFAGEPGVGKTSLVNMLAALMGLSNPSNDRYLEIAVEKGWSSRRDLIGYYNPLTKVFDSSNRKFFDALTKLDYESKNMIQDLPYLVLLDEANLSQMEYYWADFMGLCDMNKKNRRISLGEDYEFSVANTLRFVATINLDHTTEELSARLIDRAWIIKLDEIDLDFDEYNDSEITNDYPAVSYSIFSKLIEYGRNVHETIDGTLVEKFNNIKDIFQQYGIRFSPRIIGMIKKYCVTSKLVMDISDNSYTALDYAVSQKILPNINGYGEEYRKFIEALIEECDETTMPKCNALLKDILKSGNKNMQNYQFFGR